MSDEQVQKLMPTVVQMIQTLGFCGDEHKGKCIPFSLEYMGQQAKAYGWTRLARETGFTRQALMRALRKGANPTALLVLKVDEALGLGLHLGPLLAESRTIEER